MPLTSRQRWRLIMVAGATVAYFALAFAAPRTNTENTYNLPLAVLLALSLSIIGLLLLAWWFGYYAWLGLARYANRLPGGGGERTYGQMATGVWFLVSGLILSSLMSAAKPFYAGDAVVTALVTQVNYYIIIIFPFLGFLWLRNGSRHLAVSAQATMSLRTKLVTVGPPVLLLASFYIFLVATNSGADVDLLLSGPAGFLVLPINIVLVVGSWVLGLLAALNIERATHGGEAAYLGPALAKLYNGILLMTGGFLILDALMSLGATRTQALPLGFVALLIYGFIGVVALGFWIVARSAVAFTRARPSRIKAED